MIKMIFAKLNLKERWELNTVKKSNSRKDKKQIVSYRNEVGINDLCVHEMWSCTESINIIWNSEM